MSSRASVIEVAGSFNAHQVIGVLEILIAQHGAPQFLRSDNGPQFIAQALQQWLADQGIQTFYIQPASPWQNAYGESFNGKLRDECLKQKKLEAAIRWQSEDDKKRERRPDERVTVDFVY